MNCDKETVSRYDYVYETTIVKLKLALKVELIIFTMASLISKILNQAC